MARLFLFLFLGLGAGVAASGGDLTCEEIEVMVDGENATCEGMAMCDGFCKTLPAMALRVCSNESEFRQEVEQAGAILGVMCGDCGRAFLGIESLGCTPTDDMCNASTQCGSLAASMQTACADDEYFPGMNISMKEFVANTMTATCRPCMQAVNAMQYACNDPNAMCDNSSDCGKLISTVDSECGPEDVLPSGENGTMMPIKDQLGYIAMMCRPCGQAITSMQNVCYNQSEICDDSTDCGKLVSSIDSVCGPEDAFPDENGTLTNVKDLFGPVLLMCQPCLQAFYNMGDVCEETMMCDDSTLCGLWFSIADSVCGPEDVFPFPGENGTITSARDMIGSLHSMCEDHPTRPGGCMTISSSMAAMAQMNGYAPRMCA